MNKLIGFIFILPVKIYQKIISPHIPKACRFYPTCSAYTVTALRKYGAVKGLFLSVKRISRCHPWNAGGIDPVP